MAPIDHQKETELLSSVFKAYAVSQNFLLSFISHNPPHPCPVPPPSISPLAFLGPLQCPEVAYSSSHRGLCWHSAPP